MDIRREMASSATGAALPRLCWVLLYRQKGHRTVRILRWNGQQLARMPGSDRGAPKTVSKMPSCQPETGAKHRQYGHISMLSSTPGVPQPDQPTSEDDP